MRDGHQFGHAARRAGASDKRRQAERGRFDVTDRDVRADGFDLFCFKFGHFVFPSFLVFQVAAVCAGREGIIAHCFVLSRIILYGRENNFYVVLLVIFLGHLGHVWVIVAGQMTQAKSKALQAFWAGLGHLVMYSLELMKSNRYIGMRRDERRQIIFSCTGSD